MVVTPPPATLGAANVAGVLTAILALLIATAVVLILWALMELSVRLAHSLRNGSARSPRRWSLTDVLMTPMEVDLAAVGTLPTAQTVELGGADADAFDGDVAALTATLPALRAAPPMPAVPPVGSSIAVLDADCSGDHDDDPDTSWPPRPRTPGAKRYRYICASSQLVRLADLKPYGIREPRWFELN